MVDKVKTCVFISGNGTNLNSIIKSSRDYHFPIKIELIITNNIHSKGILIAKKTIYLSNIFLLKIKKNLKINRC